MADRGGRGKKKDTGKGERVETKAQDKQRKRNREKDKATKQGWGGGKKGSWEEKIKRKVLKNTNFFYSNTMIYNKYIWTLLFLHPHLNLIKKNQTIE